MKVLTSAQRNSVLKTMSQLIAEERTAIIAANKIDEPFDEVILDEPVTINISPFCREPVIVDNLSNLPLLCCIN